MRIILFLVFILLLFKYNTAQHDSLFFDEKIVPKHHVIEASVHGGKIVSNFPDFPSSKISFLYEIGYQRLTNGNKLWHQYYKYPQIGISLLYGYYGNKNVLGQNISILPSISFYKNRHRKTFYQLKIGMGFAYFNKPYQKKDNPGNIIIGSHITNISAISLSINRNITNNIVFSTGLSAFHFSNGHYQLPNVGLNLPCLNATFKYLPASTPDKYYLQVKEVQTKKILLNIYTGVGFHEFGNSIGPTGGITFPVYAGSVYLSRRYSTIGNLHSGLFINYYTSFYDYILTQEFYSEQQRKKSFTCVGFLGHEYFIGRLAFVVQGGIYLYNPFRKDYTHMTYERRTFGNEIKLYNTNKLGLQYYFINPINNNKHKLYAGMYIKANFGQADFFEMGAGYTF